MSKAEHVADVLAFEFMTRGNFSAVDHGIYARELFPNSVTSAAGYNSGIVVTLDIDDVEFDAFSTVEVQAVGFEEGVDEPKVHLYLTRGSAKFINALPREVDGVRIVAHRTSPLIVRPEAASSRREKGNIFVRNGKLCCGTSCAPTSEQLAGTFGALVTSGNDDGLFILSNNHVFSGCNHTPPGLPILAPSSMDGRPDAPAPREIGRHHALIELRTGDPNFVTPCELDLALIRATTPNAVSSWQGDDAAGYDTPTMVTPPISMMRVKKFGRTSGLTFGTVESRSKKFTPITYSSSHFKGVVWFKDIWTVRADPGDYFAVGGDSGSLVVTEDGSHAVGIVFAANTKGDYGWIMPMPKVMGAFGGLELVSGHNV